MPDANGCALLRPAMPTTVVRVGFFDDFDLLDEGFVVAEFATLRRLPLAPGDFSGGAIFSMKFELTNSSPQLRPGLSPRRCKC